VNFLAVVLKYHDFISEFEHAKSVPELTTTCHACYTLGMQALNLRNVPVDLLRRAKAAAAMQGITLREFVFKAMEEKLKAGKKK
jgi:hypothetical protein